MLRDNPDRAAFLLCKYKNTPYFLTIFNTVTLTFSQFHAIIAGSGALSLPFFQVTPLLLGSRIGNFGKGYTGTKERIKTKPQVSRLERRP